MTPPDRSGLGVEGIQVPVVGAHVHGWPEPGRIGDGRRRVHVGPGAGGPGQRPGTGTGRVDAPVGIAHVDAPEGHGGRGIELTRAEAEVGPTGPDGPDLPAVRGSDGVRATGVVAEVQDTADEGWATLDGAAGVIRPFHPAAVEVERPEGPPLIT